MWTGISGGTPHLELVVGYPGPGLPGTEIGSLASPVLYAGSGHLAMKALLKTGVGGVTSSSDGIIMHGAPGSLATIAREGSLALPAPGKFSSLQTTDWVAQDNSGCVVYQAVLSSQSTPVVINSYNNQGIWMYNTGTTTVVARGGDDAPGLLSSDGVTMLDYLVPRWPVLFSGKVAFQSSLRGTGVTAGANDIAVFAGTPGPGGTLTALARTGVTTGAGTPAGVPGASFAKLGYARIGRSAGAETAFRGELKVVAPVTLTNNEGIWKEKNGVVTLLVREGTPSPIAGLNYGPIGEPCVGENGQIMFTSRLTGPGATTTNDSVILCEQTDGTLAVMLREGAVLATDGGPRTVSDVFDSYATPEDSRSVNVHGQVALQITFVGGHTGLVRLAMP
jgi:hypothetical protein